MALSDKITRLISLCNQTSGGSFTSLSESVSAICDGYVKYDYLFVYYAKNSLGSNVRKILMFDVKNMSVEINDIVQCASNKIILPNIAIFDLTSNSQGSVVDILENFSVKRVSAPVDYPVVITKIAISIDGVEYPPLSEILNEHKNVVLKIKKL